MRKLTNAIFLLVFVTPFGYAVLPLGLSEANDIWPFHDQQIFCHGKSDRGEEIHFYVVFKADDMFQLEKAGNRNYEYAVFRNFSVFDAADYNEALRSAGLPLKSTVLTASTLQTDGPTAANFTMTYIDKISFAYITIWLASGIDLLPDRTSTFLGTCEVPQ